MVEKEELLKHLWQGAFVEEGSLTKAVSVLRKALGDAEDGQQFIATVSRRGYRFAAPVKVVDNADLESAAQRSRKHALGWGLAGIALVALVVLAALSLGGFRRWVRGSTTVPPLRSLAVLSLENFSKDPEQDYFAEGMTEELTTELAQISALKVISHTSVAQYKGTRKLMPQIARELGVDGIIKARSSGRATKWGSPSS